MTHYATIPYSDDLLLSLKATPEGFAEEFRLLGAVKLYEMKRVSTGQAAQLAGMDRVSFMFALKRFGLSPIDMDPEELASDVDNA